MATDDLTPPTSTSTTTPPPTETLEIPFIVASLDAEATIQQATAYAVETAAARATAYAVGTQNTVDQTATATLWTDTPTPDITASIDAYRTFQAETLTAQFFQDLTATATLWTNTPTATYTPSNTPTPTATYTPSNTPTSTATYTPSPTSTNTQTPLEIALDQARNFTGTNDDWKALYPNGFSQAFNGVEMVLVPKGCFMMGSDEGDDDEQPVHEQCFDAPFWIDKTEVTNAQFRSVGCENTSSEPNQPRNCVNWFEARDFCASRDARLPTEAEWEYAARGVSNWEYPWGDEFVAENAVFGDNSGGKTANVGSRPGGASWAGALDMSGNVWEWVSSLYVDYEYNLDKSESDIDNTSARALRGGSFNLDPSILRAAYRLWIIPDSTNFNWGFRCSSSLK